MDPTSQWLLRKLNHATHPISIFFLWKGLYCQALLDFQYCIEEYSRDKKHQYFENNHFSSAIIPELNIFIQQSETILFNYFQLSDPSIIMELLQQASTRVLFLH